MRVIVGTERWSKMKGKELAEICKNYADSEIEFIFTDGDNGKFLNIRSFKNIEVCDIGHSDKVVLLTGEEE